MFVVFGVEKSSISLLKTILVDGDITPENIEMCFDRKEIVFEFELELVFEFEFELELDFVFEFELSLTFQEFKQSKTQIYSFELNFFQFEL